MFERNRIDNRPEPVSVPVEIETASGDKLAGRLRVPAGQTPLDCLNGSGGFVEFEPFGAEPRFMAKSTLAAVRLSNVPPAPRLQPRTMADFDPFQVLGIAEDADREAIRRAYVELTKTYHPDIYAGLTLPDEIAGYLEAMARRINAAYSALEGRERASRASSPRPAPSQPVYTSGQRT